MYHLVHLKPKSRVKQTWRIWVETSYNHPICADGAWPGNPCIIRPWHCQDIGMGWAAQTDNVRMFVRADSPENAIKIVEEQAEALWENAPQFEEQV